MEPKPESAEAAVNVTADARNEKQGASPETPGEGWTGYWRCHCGCANALTNTVCNNCNYKLNNPYQ